MFRLDWIIRRISVVVLRSVSIDGVKVYSFHVQGTRIFTALNNECTQINTAAWARTSDFWGLATPEGHCDRLQPGWPTPRRIR
ncbi:MAG: hypothetical protein RJB34_1374 [Pseudomonadota bacterium]|jgi:hypothetical protein